MFANNKVQISCYPSLSTLIWVALLFFTSFEHLAAQTNISTLTGELAERPGDSALREQVITTATQMKPAPAIPEEARKSFVEGTTLFKLAKDPAGAKLAIDSFNEALKVAPWWGLAYYNLSSAQELAGDYEGAQASLKYYILSAPGEEDARKAQDKIYEIGAKKKAADAEAAQKEAARLAAQDTPQARESRLVNSLNGVRFFFQDSNQDGTFRQEISVRDGIAIWRHITTHNNGQVFETEGEHVPLTGKSTTYRGSYEECNPITLTVSDDANRITQQYRCNGTGKIFTVDFRRLP